MTIIALDIETYKKKIHKETGEEVLEPVLDSREFTIGCILKDTWKKARHYTDPKLMWADLKKICDAEVKRNNAVQIYGHNHAYDFYGYADLNEPSIKWFSERPLIVGMTVRNKESVRFLDTYAIFKMKLEELGELLGYKKLEMPETIKTIEELKEYVTRDVEITMKSIMWLKNYLDSYGIKIRRFQTISQIAINVLISELKKWNRWDYEKKEQTQWGIKHKNSFFYDRDMGQVNHTKYPDEIHSAYRGGRVQAFRVGTFPKVTYKDVNNLFSFSGTKIPMPNLMTEEKVFKPEITILDKIGVSRAIVTNESCELGLLPVRTNTGSFYFKPGQTAYGTWTNMELKKALGEGYKIHNIIWSITYLREVMSPLISIYNRFYRYRKMNNDPMENYLWKAIANHGIGKMAQRRNYFEIVMDDVEKTEEYLNKGYEILKGYEFKRLYRQTVPTAQQERLKPYYCPIIPALITAYSRIHMFNLLKQVPLNELIYMDTDSIVHTAGAADLPTGKELGELKTEYDNEKFICYGRKTYSIGNIVKISGFRNRKLTMDDFEKGIITNTKQYSMKTAPDINMVGRFYTEERNLLKQKEDYEKTQELLNERKFHIDWDIDDIQEAEIEIGNVLQEIDL